jgi:hypothetical protein
LVSKWPSVAALLLHPCHLTKIHGSAGSPHPLAVLSGVGLLMDRLASPFVTHKPSYFILGREVII